MSLITIYCINCMPLRYVKDLNAKQWKQVTDALKAGPTPEQRRFIAEAVEMANQMKEEK